MRKLTMVDAPALESTTRSMGSRTKLVEARHVGAPQRDLFLRQADELSALPGLSAAGVREVSSRLVTVRELVTTLVLPLVVITGFFGQNFGGLVKRVDSLAAFLARGVGAPIALIVVVLYLLRRRGYL